MYRKIQNLKNSSACTLFLENIIKCNDSIFYVYSSFPIFSVLSTVSSHPTLTGNEESRLSIARASYALRRFKSGLTTV